MFFSIYKKLIHNAAADQFISNIKSIDLLFELSLIISTIIIAFIIWKIVRYSIRRNFVELPIEAKLKSDKIFGILSPYFAHITILLSIMTVEYCFKQQNNIQLFAVDITVKLITGLLIIRIIRAYIKEKIISGIISFIIWLIVISSIFGILTPIMKTLEIFSFSIGSLKISLVIIIKGILLFILLSRAAIIISSIIESQISDNKSLTPSIKVLLNKTSKGLMLCLAFFITLNGIGIDLSGLAFLSGAIGVGIGFGLQKVVANLISGIILLLDKSIKPGDIIESGDTYGCINYLGLRYVVVAELNGKEILIPNEELITNKVINWSHSNNLICLQIPIGISYKSDLKLAMSKMTEATNGISRILKTPPTVCHCKGFGDYCINLELKFWINDPEKGLDQIKSEVNIRIFELFAENNIEIPFPQSDVNIRYENNKKL